MDEDLYPFEHCHPCEICGMPTICEDACDDECQTIVYCVRCEDKEPTEEPPHAQ